MKLYNTFLVGILGIAALSSCISEMTFEQELAKENKGQMLLNVDLLKPETRAVTEVTNFPVIIYDAEGKEVKTFGKVGDIPSAFTLSVGNYTVESHTPGEIQKKMYEPYYKGSKEAEIKKGVSTEVDVMCKMENSIIGIIYDDEFTSTFASWEITIDDGSETALTFLNTNLVNTVYWYFGEDGVKELAVNFRGTTKEGAAISKSYKLTKDQANESYDDDRENFCGGDVLNIKFTPSDATDGKLTDITINADVTFGESNENIIVNVVDVPGKFEEEDPGQGGDNPGGGETGGDENAITLNLPQSMTISASTDKSLGDTFIKCDNGIKSIKVKIRSTSNEMISSVGDLNTNYGVDFIGGAEIVENQNVVNLFTDLNQPLSVPTLGDKEYTFPIGNFFGLLVFLSGSHTFDLVVTDINGNTKNGSVTLTVN